MRGTSTIREPAERSSDETSSPLGTAWGDAIDETHKQTLWAQLHTWWEEKDTKLVLVAGYGYRLWRIGVTYATIVAMFAVGYAVADVVSGQAALSWQMAADALQISLNAIYGRVFFAQFHLDTFQSWLATVESIFGIGVEGIFVAMLIQRFFGR